MLSLQTVCEIAALLGTTEAELEFTLRHVRFLCHQLFITDLQRPDKKPREVYDPRGALRRLQHALHKNVLLPHLDRFPASHGGVQGRSHLTAALVHAKHQFVYCGDIQSFYPSIHFRRVEKLFLGLACSPELARALTRLCTHNNRLEQGFLTSPILADRIFRPADKRIQALCDNHGLGYSRFVDDITISGKFNLKKSGIPRLVAKILMATGFRMNPDKDAYGSITGGAMILGLRLKKGKTDVGKAYNNETVRRLQDALSLAACGAFQGPYFSKLELLGRVMYVCHVNPGRKSILLPLWHALDWRRVEEEASRRGILRRTKQFKTQREKPAF